ncbi:DUF2971 domain-containing protein [Spirosoma aerophilum]
MQTPIPPVLYPRNYSEENASESVQKKDEGSIIYPLPPAIIYHYTSCNSAEKILEGRSLKFASPSSFNDPFDMYTGLLDFTSTKEQSRSWTNKVMEGKPRKDRRKMYQYIDNNKFNFLKSSRNSFDRIKDQAGVCCFSKYQDIHLMWSHYANKHDGICFGFDFHPINQRQDYALTIREVQYKAVIEPINFGIDNNAAVHHWITTKSTVWEYENEIRAIINNRKGKDLFEFERACLKKVYFGCRVSPQKIDYILSLIKKYNYQVNSKKMIIDDQTFSIKPVDLP